MNIGKIFFLRWTPNSTLLQKIKRCACKLAKKREIALVFVKKCDVFALQLFSTGSIYNDFLRLVLFGIASDEMDGFLTHELGEKV